MATLKLKRSSNPKPAETATTTDNFFEYGGKKYKVIKGGILPLQNGRATLTAADICVSAEAQEYLVKNGCSCIEEVIE